MCFLVVIVLTWKRIGNVGVVGMTYENVNIVPSCVSRFYYHGRATASDLGH